jgi:hypothetical protein
MASATCSQRVAEPVLNRISIAAVLFRQRTSKNKANRSPPNSDGGVEKMKLKIAMIISGLFVLAGLAGAQDEATKTTHKKVRTISGCLQKTGDPNEYKLTTAKGSTWEIKSDAVNLGEHVGHTVSVTGTVRNAAAHGAKEDAKEEAKEHGVGEKSTEHGHMTVTEMKMVSESCSQ